MELSRVYEVVGTGGHRLTRGEGPLARSLPSSRRDDERRERERALAEIAELMHRNPFVEG